MIIDGNRLHGEREEGRDEGGSEDEEGIKSVKAEGWVVFRR